MVVVDLRDAKVVTGRGQKVGGGCFLVWDEHEFCGRVLGWSKERWGSEKNRPVESSS